MKTQHIINYLTRLDSRIENNIYKIENKLTDSCSWLVDLLSILALAAFLRWLFTTKLF